MALQDFFIEIETRCNARCYFCDTGNKSRNPHRKSMDVGLFEKVIDHGVQLGMIDNETYINLFDRGEPSLHPKISEIIRILESRRLLYKISSNCGFIPRLNDDVMLNGLSQFIISMPGFSQESYDKIHRLPFEKVKSNIDIILAEYKRRGFRGDTVMSLHTYRFNTHELLPAQEFCNERGIIFSPYFAFFADSQMSMHFSQGTLDESAMRRAESELFLDKLTQQIKNSPKNYWCPQYDRVTVNELGELVLCCGAPRVGNDYAEGFVLGNFIDLTAEQVMARKLSASVCEGCKSSGNAYLNHNSLRPSEYLPEEKQVPTESHLSPLDAAPFSGFAEAHAENSVATSNNGLLALTETAHYGYHRLLLRANGGNSPGPVEVAFYIRPNGRSRIRVELAADNMAKYWRFDMKLVGSNAYGIVGDGLALKVEKSDGDWSLVRARITTETAGAVFCNICLLGPRTENNYAGEAAQGAILRDIELTRFDAAFATSAVTAAVAELSSAG